MKQQVLWTLIAMLSMTFLTTGCSDDDDEPTGPTATTFTVTIENVSTENMLPTDRAMGLIPLSPGVYAVYQGDDPIFTVGGISDAGVEAIAEDGETAMTVAALATNANVSESGAFMGSGGAIVPGDNATFTIEAVPGDLLQIATMFVQSNDWFYAFGGGGLALFNGDTPISGDVTSSIMLYDAGTEEDTAPGEGPDQKLAQGDEINVGPDDDNTAIRLASEDGFTIPANNTVIKVTITPGS